MKSLDVLITTIKLRDPVDLLKKMNIQSDFLIGNQCAYDKTEKIFYGAHKGFIFSRNETGVGRNRNIVMNNSCADICIFADDDMIFYDGYEERVISIFDNFPYADLIIFNLGKEDTVSYDNERKNKKVKSINKMNYMNYGAARIAFRRKKVSYAGVSFNINFGGGTKYQAGEDTLFLKDCLDKGLKVIAVPVSMAYLSNERESTWFQGYNEKYFIDKGAFCSVAYGRLALPVAFVLIIKHFECYKSSRISFRKIIHLINKGIKEIDEA